MVNKKSGKKQQVEKSHPWRLCPGGEHWVRTHPRRVQVSKKNPTGIREASWEETVAEYKSYLCDIISGKNPNPKNFQTFKDYYERLKK